MASSDDLQSLRRGDLDLSGCDFSDVDLSGTQLQNRNFNKSKFNESNFREVDFSGSEFRLTVFANTKCDHSIFDKAQVFSGIVSSSFHGSSLRNANFDSSSITDADFSNADFRGASFKNVTFGDGCKFDNALFDFITDFEGVTIARSSAKQPIFSNFEYKGGTLTRHVDAQHSTSPDQVISARETDIIRLLSTRPAELADMALAISASVEAEIERQRDSKPNDLGALAKWQDYYEFLSDLASKLRALHSAIGEAASGHGSPVERFQKPASIVAALRSKFSDWIGHNSNELVDSGSRLALIGLGTGFLGLCGAPVASSFLVVSALLGGPKVIETVKDAVKEAKSAD